MRVLIVDDESAARRRLAIMLSELDVEVVGEAKNGLEALQLVRERRPDVILLDITMPEVDGFDVAQHLPEPRPLIVFQTAFDEYALEAFDHEAIDYLVKPVMLPKLQRAILWQDRAVPLRWHDRNRERARRRASTHALHMGRGSPEDDLGAAGGEARRGRCP